jgi:hypothetical protein
MKNASALYRFFDKSRKGAGMFSSAIRLRNSSNLGEIHLSRSRVNSSSKRGRSGNEKSAHDQWENDKLQN